MQTSTCQCPTLRHSKLTCKLSGVALCRISPQRVPPYPAIMSSTTVTLAPYQREFIEFALSLGVLRFGTFKLKSGRTSPYFFNAGLFQTSGALSRLADFYAAAIESSGIAYDGLFGPAYKGIPLVSVTAVALFRAHGVDKPYSFNRKEAKDHGEGGTIVGAPLKGQILIVDDVITAGTAVREAFDIIKSNGAAAAGVVVALDRNEVTGGVDLPEGCA